MLPIETGEVSCSHEIKDLWVVETEFRQTEMFLYHRLTSDQNILKYIRHSFI